MKIQWANKQAGFTLVELLIVIVVIAILAAISTVAYNGVQDRARSASLDSTLNQIAKKLRLYKVDNDSYPASLEDIAVDDTDTETTLDYSANGEAYCVSGSIGDVSRVVSAANSTPVPGDCATALVKWTISGTGVTYDSSDNKIVLGDTTGYALSPMVATNGTTSARITTEVYVAQASSANAPAGSNYFSSQYFAADKTTAATNSSGYTSNGNASCDIPLNAWTTCTWTTPTGPNVEYVRFFIRSSPTQYTSPGDIYRNVSISVQ